MARIASFLTTIILWASLASAQDSPFSAETFAAPGLDELVFLQGEQISVLEAQAAAQTEMIKLQAAEISQQQEVIDALIQANNAIIGSIGNSSPKGLWNPIKNILPLGLAAATFLIGIF